MSIAVKQNISYPWHYVFEIFKERLNNYMGLPTKPLLTCKRKVKFNKKSVTIFSIAVEGTAMKYQPVAWRRSC